jgi:hypothetical protein
MMCPSCRQTVLAGQSVSLVVHDDEDCPMGTLIHEQCPTDVDCLCGIHIDTWREAFIYTGEQSIN